MNGTDAIQYEGNATKMPWRSMARNDDAATCFWDFGDATPRPPRFCRAAYLYFVSTVFMNRSHLFFEVVEKTFVSGL